MSFVEVLHIVTEASASTTPADVMQQLTTIDMSELSPDQIAILYGKITKDMPCLSGYLPIDKRIIGELSLAGAIPTRQSRYE